MLLEQVSVTAQNNVRIAYDKYKHQFVAIKTFAEKKSYLFERCAYEYLKRKNVSHLTMQLLLADDE